MKKAQGLPLNAIILAVIAILVLVIIVGLTTGFFGNVFGKEVSNQCTISGGVCALNACPEGSSKSNNWRANEACTKLQEDSTQTTMCCVAKVI